MSLAALRHRVVQVVQSVALGNFQMIGPFTHDHKERLWICPELRGEIRTAGYVLTLHYLLLAAGIRVGRIHFSKNHDTYIFSVEE